MVDQSKCHVLNKFNRYSRRSTVPSIGNVSVKKDSIVSDRLTKILQFASGPGRHFKIDDMDQMNETVQSDIFQMNDDITWEEAGPGIQRQVYGYNHQLMLVKVRFEKNAVGTLHEHYHTQVSYVESGVFELTIGDETKRLQKGDGYYVPPHVIHGCRCIESGILVDVFSPFREEFLK